MSHLKRIIAVMVGSESDLKKCLKGLKYLKDMEDRHIIGNIEVGVYSIHRNTERVLAKVRSLVRRKVDVLIVGAGMANHLTGTVDAYLRHTLKNSHVVVVGVAFEGINEAHNMAATLGISCVPGSQVVFENFCGSEGFFRACKFAVIGNLPLIKIPESKPTATYSLAEAIEFVEKEALALGEKHKS